MVDDDYEKVLRELRFKQVSESFKKDRKEREKHLEELGFTWVDDDEDDQEKTEELAAIPKNINQETLICFFDNKNALSNELLDMFFTEKESETPNYPLFRKYFKKGNNNLKQLILFGLEKHPSNIGLLNDLSYFHWNHGILGEVIKRYLIACDIEQDLKNFDELAKDFYYNTIDDGYDALYELKQKFNVKSEKGNIVMRIYGEVKTDPVTIKF
jgi:hypothetical protein